MRDQPPHRILILAAHGSPHPQAVQALGDFTARVQEAFPDCRTFLAYTALKRGDNHPAAFPGGQSLVELLSQLSSHENADLRVQSLHVIAGDEFDRMSETLKKFASSRPRLSLAISGPLLSGPRDAPDVADTLAGCLDGPEPVVLMGHGTTHEAQDLYRLLAAHLRDALPTARLGVLEAADPDDPLSIQAIARDLAASGTRSVRLAPFLTVAGRHAHKDLAGEQPGSWKSVLSGQGIACRPDLAGLVERDCFASAWLNRIGRLLAVR